MNFFERKARNPCRKSSNPVPNPTTISENEVSGVPPLDWARKSAAKLDKEKNVNASPKLFEKIDDKVESTESKKQGTYASANNNSGKAASTNMDCTSAFAKGDIEDKNSSWRESSWHNSQQSVENPWPRGSSWGKNVNATDGKGSYEKARAEYHNRNRGHQFHNRNTSNMSYYGRQQQRDDNSWHPNRND